MFERRPAPSALFSVLSPILAIALTLITGFGLMALLGHDPARAMETYFLAPLQDPYLRSEIGVKAIPLAIIGVGLAIAFRAGVFNIGAAGQYTLGAIFGGGAALFLPQGPWLLPLAMLGGLIGGALWAWIPAILRNRFNVNEILVSLMLTYVATLLLDWLVRGPWQSEEARGFPQSDKFSTDAVMPILVEYTRLHLGAVIALICALFCWWLLFRSERGFGIRVLGMSQRAARFAGFSERGTIMFVFLLSGALAGLAGAIEVSATVKQLQPDISSEYGFTAIIVAFLGRLHPVGVVLAALALAVTYIGGEEAQMMLKLPESATLVFQGILLFFLLACDTLINYRLRLGNRKAA